MISNYRKDIDGLRALAVLGVLLFHFFPDKYPGGFVGVDIFFVISGYLITKNIVSDISLQKFSFKEFFLKRVRRIFPALFVVLIMNLVLGYFFFLPKDFNYLRNQIIAGAYFSYNFVAANNTGYFEGLSNYQPLLHLWSLGVEEQFYFLLPVLLVLSFSRNKSLNWLIIFFFFSFVFGLVQSYLDTKQSYFFPLSRFWQIFAGSILSLTEKKWINFASVTTDKKSVQLFREFLFVFSLVMTLLCFKFVSKRFVYPGWIAILPTTLAIFFISIFKESILQKKIFENKVLVLLGLISYPLYLFHWPIITWSKYYLDQFGVPQSLLLLSERQLKYFVIYSSIFVSLSCSYIFYVKVEKPIRKLDVFSMRNYLIAALVLIAIPFSSVVTSMLKEHKYKKNGSLSFMKKYDFSDDTNEFMKSTIKQYRKDCSFLDLKNNVRLELDPSCYGEKEKELIFLWGDSYAEHLRFGIEKFLTINNFSNQFSIAQITSSSCPPSISKMEGNLNDHKACNLSRNSAIQFIKDRKPKIVVLAQAEGHLNGELEQLVSILGTELKNSLIVVVGPVPRWKEELNKLIVKYYWPSNPNILKNHLVNSIFEVDFKLQERIKSMRLTQVIYLSALNAFCDRDGCMAFVPAYDELSTFDSGHLTLKGSEILIEKIFRDTVDQSLKN